MNVAGIVILVAMVGLAGYLVFTLVRDIIDRKKNKGG